MIFNVLIVNTIADRVTKVLKTSLQNNSVKTKKKILDLIEKYIEKDISPEQRQKINGIRLI